MIRLSPRAEIQLASLTDYYAERGRDDAVRNLADSVERAWNRLQSGRGLFLGAPRPYSELSILGLRWTREGVYWVAFSDIGGEPIVAGVFHVSADIPNRL